MASGWSKIKKKIEEIMHESLKGKINIQMKGYRDGLYGSSRGGHFSRHQGDTIFITYNKDVILTTYNDVGMAEWCLKQYSDDAKRQEWESNFLYDKKYDTNTFFDKLREYLDMKHEESSKINDIYFRMFTLLDKRTGIRTLEKLVDDYYVCDNVELKKLYSIVFDIRGIEYFKDFSEQEEPMVTIFSLDYKYDNFIKINPDVDGKPYFKWYRGYNTCDAVWVCRIEIESGNMIIDSKGKIPNKTSLNDLEIKRLNHYLNSKYRNNYKYSVFDVIKYYWNYENEILITDIDDYYTGKYDEEYKDDPIYISSKVNMPKF